MNNRTLKTYHDIYKNPVQSGIPWEDVETMFLALGAKISEGAGSRVRVALNGVRAVFHRPHPENTTDKGAMKSVRKLLDYAGVKL